MTLHPEVVELLQKRAALDLAPYHSGTPDKARQSFQAAHARLPPNRGARIYQSEDFRVNVADGEIDLRLYQPKPEPAAGTIVYFHGGGWVIGTIEAFDPVCRELAAASGLDVLSVGYRLAPEHPFPGPLDDAFAALGWAEKRFRRPLLVMGDSAGANLAAACALKAQDLGGPAISLQVLIYPVVDADFFRDSYKTFGTGDYLVSTQDMEWFWRHYVPDPTLRKQPLAAPIHAENMAGLPPAIIAVAGRDPLCDEGIAYANKLRDAGIPTTLEHFPDMIHGFFTMVDLLTPANAAIQRIGREIGATIGSSGGAA